jgi:aldehyde:ferredoxin oxidoreductase
LIDEQVTGGIALRFGAADAVLELIELIARRDGFGAVLADGSARAARQLGRGCERYAQCVKGKEVPPHEPRNKPGLALAYAVGPIGPDFCAVEHDPDFDPEIGLPLAIQQSRAFGLLEWLPETELSARKVRQTVVLERWWSGALESLLFCLCATAPVRYLAPKSMAALVEAVTGWDFSVHEFMQIGERRINLMRWFNRRAGLGARDDRLPDRFFDEPIRGGAYDAVRLDRSAFEAAIELYYQLSGWDSQGTPRPAKLHELELDWLLGSTE